MNWTRCSGSGSCFWLDRTSTGVRGSTCRANLNLRSEPEPWGSMPIAHRAHRSPPTSVKHPVSCQDFLSLEHTCHTLTQLFSLFLLFSRDHILPSLIRIIKYSSAYCCWNCKIR